jgi:hypothetical protein
MIWAILGLLALTGIIIYSLWKEHKKVDKDVLALQELLVQWDKEIAKLNEEITKTHGYLDELTKPAKEFAPGTYPVRNDPNKN